MKAWQKYPSFTYRRSLTTEGRIILLDEPLDQPVRAALQALETKDGQELLFFEDRQLANSLESILAELIEENPNSLFVFPGNGSNYPRQLSRICQESASASVYAKRCWQPGTAPIVMAGIILPDVFLIMDVKTIVVVDDVISSGLTMQKIHQNNAWRFTQAKWIGVSWISQLPQMRAQSGVKGYARVATACVVGKANGMRVPINSISTLRQQPAIAKSYAQRHFQKPETFLDLLSR